MLLIIKYSKDFLSHTIWMFSSLHYNCLLYLYIVSQTSGIGNASNTAQDTSTSSIQGILSDYTCNEIISYSNDY